MANEKQKKDQPIIVEVGGLRAECYSDSIVLTWRELTEYNSEDDPVIYQVYYKEKDLDESWQTVLADPGVVTLTELQPDTEYSIFVKAYNDAGTLGSFPESDDFMVARTTPPLDEEAPTVISSELVVTERTSTTLSVKWNAASDNETEADQIRYEVYLNGALKKDEEGITFFSFTELKANTQYTISVKAYDEAGNVLVYPDFLTKTLDDRAPIVNNPNLAVKDRSAKSITIQWIPATDNDTKPDEILYKVLRNGIVEREEKGISSHTFTGLEPNTEYTFCVKAYDAAGNGGFIYSAKDFVGMLTDEEGNGIKTFTNDQLIVDTLPPVAYLNAGNYYITDGDGNAVTLGADESMIYEDSANQIKWIKQGEPLELVVADEDGNGGFDGSSGLADVAISLNGSEYNKSEYSAQIDERSYAPSFEIGYDDLQPGVNTIVIMATDNVGNRLVEKRFTLYKIQSSGQQNR